MNSAFLICLIIIVSLCCIVGRAVESSLECRADSCINGGTCVMQHRGSLECICTEEFTGQKCEQPVKADTEDEENEMKPIEAEIRQDNNTGEMDDEVISTAKPNTFTIGSDRNIIRIEIKRVPNTNSQHHDTNNDRVEIDRKKGIPVIDTEPESTADEEDEVPSEVDDSPDKIASFTNRKSSHSKDKIDEEVTSETEDMNEVIADEIDEEKKQDELKQENEMSGENLKIFFPKKHGFVRREHVDDIDTNSEDLDEDAEDTAGPVNSEIDTEKENTIHVQNTSPAANLIAINTHTLSDTVDTSPLKSYLEKSKGIVPPIFLSSGTTPTNFPQILMHETSSNTVADDNVPALVNKSDSRSSDKEENLLKPELTQQSIGSLVHEAVESAKLQAEEEHEKKVMDSVIEKSKELEKNEEQAEKLSNQEAAHIQQASINFGGLADQADRLGASIQKSLDISNSWNGAMSEASDSVKRLFGVIDKFISTEEDKVAQKEAERKNAELREVYEKKLMDEKEKYDEKLREQKEAEKDREESVVAAEPIVENVIHDMAKKIAEDEEENSVTSNLVEEKIKEIEKAESGGDKNLPSISELPLESKSRVRGVGSTDDEYSEGERVTVTPNFAEDKTQGLQMVGRVDVGNLPSISERRKESDSNVEGMSINVPETQKEGELSAEEKVLKQQFVNNNEKETANEKSRSNRLVEQQRQNLPDEDAFNQPGSISMLVQSVEPEPQGGIQEKIFPTKEDSLTRAAEDLGRQESLLSELKSSAMDHEWPVSKHGKREKDTKVKNSLPKLSELVKLISSSDLSSLTEDHVERELESLNNFLTKVLAEEGYYKIRLVLPELRRLYSMLLNGPSGLSKTFQEQTQRLGWFIRE